MKLVGLTGLAGSGKSTVARYLVREHGFTQLSFAGPSKAMLRELDPVLGVSLKYGTANPQNMHLAEIQAMGEWKVNHGAFAGTPEDYIRASQYGKEYGRILAALTASHPAEFWVELAMAELTDEDGSYVFDDVKTPFEASAVNAYNPWGLWHVKNDVLGEPAADASHWEHLAGRMGETQIVHNIEGNVKFLHESVDRALRLAFSDTAPLAEAS